MAELRALIVAADTFSHDVLEDLDAPARDAEEMDRVLSDADRCGFTVRKLINPSLIEVQTAISDLYRDRYPQDIVLFYYSGHGVRDEYGDLYLALDGTDPERPEVASLGAAFLKSAMERSHSERQITILDCCHAGAFSGDGAKGATTIAKPDIDPGGHGRYTMVATRDAQLAFEADGRSAYTAALVEALDFAGTASNAAMLTVRDLHSHARQRLRQDGLKMQPELWSEEREPLIIARNPNAIRQSFAALPAEPAAPARASNGLRRRDFAAFAALACAVLLFALRPYGTAPVPVVPITAHTIATGKMQIEEGGDFRIDSIEKVEIAGELPLMVAPDVLCLRVYHEPKGVRRVFLTASIDKDFLEYRDADRLCREAAQHAKIDNHERYDWYRLDSLGEDAVIEGRLEHHMPSTRNVIFGLPGAFDVIAATDTPS